MAIKFYRLKEGQKCDGLDDCKDGVPLDKYDEVSESDFLNDRTGKVICYGSHDEVSDKMKARFGWPK